MTDASESGAKRYRSPPYPALPLSKAIDRAKQLYGKVLHHAVGAKAVADAWAYGTKSSGLYGTIAALLHFGLLKDEGTGEKRRFQLTESAIRIIRDPNPESEKRIAAIKQAAVTPKIFRELWESYGSAQSLSDVVFKSHLTVDRAEHGLAAYSDAAADDVIRVYRETIAFAKLSDSDIISGGSGEKAAQEGSAMLPENEDQVPESSNIREENIGVGIAQRRDVSDINVVQKGSRLQISATVDLDGIERLKKMLDAYGEALKLMQ